MKKKSIINSSAIVILSISLLSSCGNKDVTNKETKHSEDITTEQSTRTPESVVGKWYECNDGDWVDIWKFEDNGEYYHTHEDNYGKEDETYEIARRQYSVEDSKIILNGREAVLEYTDYGLYIKYVGTEKGIELYEYRQDALESSDRYWTSDKYYETLKDENGCVIKEGVLIKYFTNDKKIIIPDNVTELREDVIVSNLERIDKLIIPENIKRIGEEAFWEIPLNVIIIEEGVEEIGASAFEDSYFNEIHIPASVKSIGEDAFRSTEVNSKGKIFVQKGSYAEEYFEEYLNGKDYDGAEIIVEK